MEPCAISAMTDTTALSIVVESRRRKLALAHSVQFTMPTSQRLVPNYKCSDMPTEMDSRIFRYSGTPQHSVSFFFQPELFQASVVEFSQ